MLGSLDAGSAVNVVIKGDSDILHVVTATQLHVVTYSQCHRCGLLTRGLTLKTALGINRKEHKDRKEWNW